MSVSSSGNRDVTGSGDTSGPLQGATGANRTTGPGKSKNVRSGAAPTAYSNETGRRASATPSGAKNPKGRAVSADNATVNLGSGDRKGP